MEHFKLLFSPAKRSSERSYFCEDRFAGVKFKVFHHCVSLAPHVEHSFGLGTSLCLGDLFKETRYYGRPLTKEKGKLWHKCQRQRPRHSISQSQTPCVILAELSEKKRNPISTLVIWGPKNWPNGLFGHDSCLSAFHHIGNLQWKVLRDISIPRYSEWPPNTHTHTRAHTHSYTVPTLWKDFKKKIIRIGQQREEKIYMQ